MSKMTIKALEEIVDTLTTRVTALEGVVHDQITRVIALEADKPQVLTNVDFNAFLTKIGYTRLISSETEAATEFSINGDNWYIAVERGYYLANTDNMRLYLRSISDAARKAGHYSAIERDGRDAFLRVGHAVRSKSTTF